MPLEKVYIYIPFTNPEENYDIGWDLKYEIAFAQN
jgi:hypothetical protein